MRILARLQTLARFFEEISDKTLSLAHTKRAVDKICSGNGGIVLKVHSLARPLPVALRH